MAIGCNVHANRAFAGLPPIMLLWAATHRCVKNSCAPWGRRSSDLLDFQPQYVLLTEWDVPGTRQLRTRRSDNFDRLLSP